MQIAVHGSKAYLGIITSATAFSASVAHAQHTTKPTAASPTGGAIVSEKSDGTGGWARDVNYGSTLATHENTPLGAVDGAVTQQLGLENGGTVTVNLLRNAESYGFILKHASSWWNQSRAGATPLRIMVGADGLVNGGAVEYFNAWLTQVQRAVTTDNIDIFACTFTVTGKVNSDVFTA